MIKHIKAHIVADSALGAIPVRVRYGAAKMMGKCSAGDALGAKFKQYLIDLEARQSGATIIVKGKGTEEVLKELAK